MRQLVLAALVACGGGDQPAVDSPPPPIDMPPPDMNTSSCVPATLFLVTDGGTYTAGPDDSRANKSNVAPAGGVTFDPYTAPSLADARTCIAQRLQPFQITVADTDPGTADHVEIVLSPKDASEVGLNVAVISVATVTSCGQYLPNAVGVAWPARGNDVAADTCDLVVQIMGTIAGLDYTSTCADTMAFNPLTTGCGGAFTNAAQPCQNGTCRCGGSTQNSFQRMVSAYCPR